MGAREVAAELLRREESDFRRDPETKLPTGLNSRSSMIWATTPR